MSHAELKTNEARQASRSPGMYAVLGISTLLAVVILGAMVAFVAGGSAG